MANEGQSGPPSDMLGSYSETAQDQQASCVVPEERRLLDGAAGRSGVELARQEKSEAPSRHSETIQDQLQMRRVVPERQARCAAPEERHPLEGAAGPGPSRPRKNKMALSECPTRQDRRRD
jgi:hypothetical protein